MNPLFPDEKAPMTWGDYWTFKIAWGFAGLGLCLLAFVLLALVAAVRPRECPKCGRSMKRGRDGNAIFWECLFHGVQRAT